MGRKTETRLHGMARKAILKGVNEVYNAVRLSLGPEGAAALIHRSFNRGSRITNDGITIARCVEPKDAFENLVAIAFKEAASKTGERAGDGTTSTICIAGKLINDAFSILKDDKSETQVWGMETEGAGVIALKKHILEAIPKIKEEIKKVTKKVKTQEDLVNIADVSLAGNREVAEIVAEMVWKTGEDGFITLEDGFLSKLETSLIEGARFPMKPAHPVFLNNPSRYEMVAEDCEILITNYKIDTLSDFTSFWNVLKRNKIIIVASDFSMEVMEQMAKLIAPKQLPTGEIVPSGIKIFPIKAPSLGSADLTPHNFNDLADFCNASFINKELGQKLKDIKEYDLGFVQKIVVKSTEDRQDAVILGGEGVKSDKVKKRIEMLKGMIEKTKMPEHKGLLNKRIASLAAAGGMIKVGAPTDAEALPLKHKIEDAIFACQQALKHGYVEGGGLCLKKIAEKFFDKDRLLKDALLAPYNQIQENYGSELKIEKTIIDPAKVVELEVEHGLGVAASMITIKAIIPEFDENDPKNGYQLIADAIMTGVMYWAKQNGLYQSGIKEANVEALQKQEAMIQRELGD